jgi:hypothetical protein
MKKGKGFFCDFSLSFMRGKAVFRLAENRLLLSMQSMLMKNGG